MTCAGCGLAGTPGTGSPAAHATPSRMSESSPPHFPSTRTGRIFAAQSMPATPLAVVRVRGDDAGDAVPCHELGFDVALPWKSGIASVGRVDPVAGIATHPDRDRRHRWPLSRIADEIVARQDAAGQIRMRSVSPVSTIATTIVGRAGRHVPRRDRVDAARRILSRYVCCAHSGRWERRAAGARRPAATNSTSGCRGEARRRARAPRPSAAALERAATCAPSAMLRAMRRA